MVKKAVAAINSEGTEKAYAEIDDPKGPVRRPRPLHRGVWNGWSRACGIARTRRASASICSTTRMSTARNS